MIDPRDLERARLFDGLSDARRSEAVAAFRTFELGPGEDLLVEGEPDRGMVVVVDGELAVSLGGVELARLQAGETAGEMALFGSFDRRSATVSTVVGSRLLVLDDRGLKSLRAKGNPLATQLEVHALRTIARRVREMDARIARHAPGEPVERRRPRGLLSRVATTLGASADLPDGAPPSTLDALRGAPGFADADASLLERIAGRLEMVAVPVGEAVVEAGERGDDAFLVAEGKIGVYRAVGDDRVERVATLGPGHVFGQVALADPSEHDATCRALEPAWLLRIPGAAYRLYESETTPEARTFRRGMIDALSIRLRLANERLLSLESRGG